MARTLQHYGTCSSIESSEHERYGRPRPITCESLWKEEYRDPLAHIPRSGAPAHAVKRHKINGTFWYGERLPSNSDAFSFMSLLKTCRNHKDLDRGIQLHDDILHKGLLEECADALMIMYVKCGALTNAKKLLDMHNSRDVSVWTALITGYAHQGQGHQAFDCYERMLREGISPSPPILSSILKACGSIKAIHKGEQIHDEIARHGLLDHNVVLGNALVDMYAKCGALTKAQSVLQELPSRNVVTWNAIISGYAQHGHGKQALECLEWMKRDGLSPNVITLMCSLKACGSIKALDKGEKIHNQVAKQGLFRNDVALNTALVDMYAKCGALAKAQQVLDQLPSRDVITWSALIAGYAQHGQGKKALNCFERMKREGISPNAVTYACIVKACGSIGALGEGEKIHNEISMQGLLGNDIVLGGALVDMYAKCGALAKAQQVFEELPSRDVIAWSSLIAGYAQEGQGEQALHCFEKMQCEGLSPNAVTFSCILQACGSLGAEGKGQKVHDEITRQGMLRNNAVLHAALVDMYAKCGAFEKAVRVLEELPPSDVVPWNALMTGYVQYGQSEQVLSCFERMQREGLSPNAVTFSCVLNSCSRLGLVDEGHMLFLEMSTKYGVKPVAEHYACMVDLFGRAGHLDKAVGVIQEMPLSNSMGVWSALLGACQKWGDVYVGRWAFERSLQIDKGDGAAYVLMANIYAAAGMQEDADNIEAMRMENTACKEAAKVPYAYIQGQ